MGAERKFQALGVNCFMKSTLYSINVSKYFKDSTLHILRIAMNKVHHLACLSHGYPEPENSYRTRKYFFRLILQKPICLNINLISVQQIVLDYVD
jgi:hypothetical protein